MNKLTFSYIFSFFVVLAACVLALSYTGEKEKLDGYMRVVIQEGDSLWEIADQYKDYDHLSHSDFVQWVQEKNDLQTLVVKPGETIVIPVEKTKFDNANYLANQ